MEEWVEYFGNYLENNNLKTASECMASISDDEWQRLMPLFDELFSWARKLGFEEGLAEAQIRAMSSEE